ncbi:MAG: phosphoglycerate dehydrogenase [Candidatus Omnitrophica bacterium]|nr:phosphoglycerate dehydrogenase [Candidatus Omnitrophota bacterium]
MQLLRDAGCELIVPLEFGPHGGRELEKRMQGMDAILATLDRFTVDTFKSRDAASLKVVSRWGVGFDSIDVPAATQAGVIVTYTPDLLNETVADFAFALILTLARHVHESHQAMSNGLWQPLWGSNVFNKTLGLIGCGRIGQAVARRARGFHMRLMAYDIHPSAEAASIGVKFVPLEELLASSDFVSLHAAATTDNHDMIGEAQLRQMKPTAFMVNTARGTLVDESALELALREGRLAGAALDTFKTEPLPAGHPLRRAPNVLLTSHHASWTIETGQQVSLCAAQAIVDAQQGRRPRFAVNPAVFDSPALRAVLV